MNAWRSLGRQGLPVGRDFHRQNRRNPLRCHRISVSGFEHPPNELKKIQKQPACCPDQMQGCHPPIKEEAHERPGSHARKLDTTTVYRPDGLFCAPQAQSLTVTVFPSGPLGQHLAGYFTVTVLSASMVTDLVTGEPFKGAILTS